MFRQISLLSFTCIVMVRAKDRVFGKIFTDYIAGDLGVYTDVRRMRWFNPCCTHCSQGEHSRPGVRWSRWPLLVLRLDLCWIWSSVCFAGGNGINGTHSVCRFPDLRVLQLTEDTAAANTIGCPSLHLQDIRNSCHTAVDGCKSSAATSIPLQSNLE